MSLSEIVSVTIQAGTVNPARAGFGIPLLMSHHSEWSDDEVRSYSTFSGVAADFDSTSMPYKWAAAMFAQNPRPAVIKIGRMAAPASGHSTVLSFGDMPTGSTITGSVVSPDGTSTAISVAWNTDIATTLAALETALEAISGIASATVASTNVTVLATAGAGMFHFSFSTAGVDVRDTTADWDYDDALTAAAVRDGDFFMVFADNNSPKNMDKIARWALANDRVAAFGPQYTKPSQFASGEFTSGDDYTALMANPSAFAEFTEKRRSEFPEAAWAGMMLPRDPGSATWAFKSPAGSGADTYTSTERTLIESSTHRGNHLTSEAGVAITRPGKVFSGEWIDVVIGLAWLEARLQERLYAALLNNPKIPYTDAGLALLVAEVRAQLREAQDRGVLDAGWSVTVLPVASQSSADRAARIVRGLEFQARLAGAVHMINLVGTVTA